MMSSVIGANKSMADFFVDVQPGSFASCLRTRRHFAKGEILTLLDKATHSDNQAYSSVQCGKGLHIELNCEFLYVNHSCDPNTFFDLSHKDRHKWQVRAAKDIKAGSSITFFYPSTEWEMDQPFQCTCGAKSCLRWIEGAKTLTLETVSERGFVNSWIGELMVERDASLTE